MYSAKEYLLVPTILVYTTWCVIAIKENWIFNALRFCIPPHLFLDNIKKKIYTNNIDQKIEYIIYFLCKYDEVCI